MIDYEIFFWDKYLNVGKGGILESYLSKSKVINHEYEGSIAPKVDSEAFN